jgi:hypothetical protein
MKTLLRITFHVWSFLVLLTTPLVVVTAQGNNAPPLLYIIGKDSKNPVQFQAIMPDQAADSTALGAKASIPAGTTDATVYIAFKSTGWWTQSVIGLLSGSLVRDNQYVALEVDEAGAPLANGQAFALKYKAGYFLLPVVIQEPQRLGVFQITTDGGVTVTGETPVLDGTTLTQSTVEYQVNPESPLGNIVLDCHITAP